MKDCDSRNKDNQKCLTVEYSSNNSGGSWWLKDEDWLNLEKAGWKVEWISEMTHPEPDPKCKECKGTGIVTDRGYDDNRCFCASNPYLSFGKITNNGHRYHEGLAKQATLQCNSIKDALESFEKVIGQSVTDEGCNCCGPPHNFTWSGSGCLDQTCECMKKKGAHKDYNYGSGEDLSRYLLEIKDAPSNYREALEKIKELQEIKK